MKHKGFSMNLKGIKDLIPLILILKVQPQYWATYCLCLFFLQSRIPAAAGRDS
jgi:hypothetical protein